MAIRTVKPSAWPWRPGAVLGRGDLRARLALIWPFWPEQPTRIYTGSGGVSGGSGVHGAPVITSYGQALTGSAWPGGGGSNTRLWKGGLERLSGASGITHMFLLQPLASQTVWGQYARIGRLDSSHYTIGLSVGSVSGKVFAKMSTSGGDLNTGDSGALTTGNWYWAVVRWASGGYLKVDLYNPDGTAGPASTQSAGTISGTVLADRLDTTYALQDAAMRLLVGYTFNTSLTDTQVAALIDDPFALLAPAEPESVEYVAGAAPTETARFYLSVAPLHPAIQPPYSTQWHTVDGDPGQFWPSPLVADPADVAGVGNQPDPFYHQSDSSGWGPTDAMGRGMWWSAPLSGPGTLAGTIKGRMRTRENDAGANANLAMIVRVVSGDGLTERGVALALTAGNATGGSNPEAAVGTLNSQAVNREFPYGGPLTLTPVEYQDGDRICIEEGMRFCVTNSYKVAYCLTTTNLADGDLPEDTTSTLDALPWVEFLTYDPIVFQGAAQHGNPLANRLVEFTTDNAAVCDAPPDDYTDEQGQVVTPIMPLKAAGTAHVQAHCEGHDSNIATVIATAPASVVSITVTPTAPDGMVGETVLLTAVCWDGPNGTGNVLTGQPVGWSIDDGTLAHWPPPGLGQTMLVSLDKAGTAHVRAWVGSVGSNTVAITITAHAGPAVGRIVLTPTSLAGQVGGQGAVQATVYSTGATLAEKRAGLLAYLAGLNTGTANRVLTGQDTNHYPWMELSYLNDVVTQTGKATAIAGVPVYWHGCPDPTAFMLQVAAQGYLVHTYGLWTNPQTGGDQHDTTITFHNLLVAGATRTAWFAMLDTVAARLQQLRDAGHVVLFRPFAEQNGNWFWWCCPFRASAADYAAVWIEMYDYLMTTKGLADCLIWTWNVYAGSSNYYTGYPGDAYVDLVSFNKYGNNPGVDCQTTYAALQAKAKPIWIAEFGCTSSDYTLVTPHSFDNSKLITDIVTYLPNVIAFMIWSGPWAIGQQNGPAALMNHAWSISRDEMPSMGEQVLTDRLVTFGSSEPTVASVS